MKTPLILQQEATECGLACLLMILKRYGSTISLESLRKKFTISMRGTSIAELIRIATLLKLKAETYFIRTHHISTLSLPAIFHWRNNHYVVIDRFCAKKGYHILDPANGACWLNKEEIEHHFSGFVISLTKEKQFEPLLLDHSPLLKGIISGIPKLFSHMTLTALLTLIIHALVLLFPVLIQRLIDPYFSTTDITKTIKFSAFALIALKLCEAGIYLLRGISIIKWERIFTDYLGSKVISHLFHLPLRYFESRALNSVYTKFNSIEKTREIISRGLAESLVDGLFSLLIFVILYAINVKIWLVMCLLTLFYLLLNIYIAHIAHFHNEIQIRERTKETAFLLDCLRAITPIKLFQREASCISKWLQLHRKHLMTASKIYILQSLLDSSRILIFGIQTATVVLMGLWLIKQHQLSLGALYALLFYINALSKNISSITSKLFDMKTISTHVEQIRNILIYDQESAVLTHSIFEHIHHFSLSDISFRYHRNDAWVLKNVNLSFYAGERIFLIGPSGQGKSTLLKIMLGLMPPTSGTVAVNHQPLTPALLSTYRSRISAIMQDDELLSGSIYENISFFAKDIDHHKVEQCADLANIADEISAMPMQYHTYLGESGMAISGGQKQRILLARALYTMPAIIFLDEAFSNLDLENENAIYHRLKERGITLFIISHRAESLKFADRVIDIRLINQ